MGSTDYMSWTLILDCNGKTDTFASPADLRVEVKACLLELQVCLLDVQVCLLDVKVCLLDVNCTGETKLWPKIKMLLFA